MRVVVIGAGEVGWHISSRLVREKAEVVLIDIDRKRLELAEETLDVQTVYGFGANPETLIAAGINSADLLVAVTGNDETNILACRMAQLLATPDTRRIARIRASGYYDFFDDKRFRSDFGLNFIINPSQGAVDNILDFIGFPGITDIIDISGGRLRLAGKKLSRKHPLLGQPLSELLPPGAGRDILVTAIYRRHELLIPKGDTILQAGDLVYVAAVSGNTTAVNEFFGLDEEPIKSIIIVGGGEVGFALAKRLESDNRRFNVKIIELNPVRAEYLSVRLKRAIVIEGDGTDQDLLIEENVYDCDAFIAVSTDDEKNLISCLVAKRIGARHTITRVNRSSYAPLVAAIGLESMISARVAAISAVLKYIRKGRVISVATLANENAEIIEFEVLAASKVVGKKLMEIKFPKGAIICALTRGKQVIIPRGSNTIAAGDILAVVAKAEAIVNIGKILAGK